MNNDKKIKKEYVVIFGCKFEVIERLSKKKILVQNTCSKLGKEQEVYPAHTAKPWLE